MRNGQVLRDLGGEHIAKSFGRCVSCNRVTWGYTDHECPDWRGHFGNSTHCVLEAEGYDMQGPDVSICAYCDNTRDRYELGLKRARAMWKPLPERTWAK